METTFNWRRLAQLSLPIVVLFLLASFGWSGGLDKDRSTKTSKSAAKAKSGAKKSTVKKGVNLQEEEEREERAEAKAKKKNLGPTGPQEAMTWRMLAWRDANGQIDPNGYSRAIRQMQALREDIRSAPTSYRWLERGPDNVAGRTRSLIIDPRDANKMFCGTVGGGIWKSTNGGITWSTVSDKLPSLAISCMAFDPNNFDTIYAGTGEGFYNSDAIGGAGVLRSKDGGATWSVLSSTAGWRYINRIAVAPGNSNRILVCTQNGGVNLSTDGGISFNNVLPAQAGHQVVFDPSNGLKAVATVLDYDFGVGQWFSRASYSTDGGATWTAATGIGMTGFSSRIELAYAPSNTNIIYGQQPSGGGIVYKSVDGGHTFAQVTTSGSTGASWYCNGIWVSPTDPNFLVLTGLYTYKSINGGVTITEIGHGYIQTEQPHPDTHTITPDPGFNGTSNKRVYIGTDGGFYRTDDITTANTSTGWAWWTPAVRSSQFYSAVGDGVTGKIVGGTQDNGTHAVSKGNVNSDFWFGGDGGWSDIDKTDNNFVYGEYIYLQIFRSTQGGANANWIFTSANSANFIAPLILDPNNVNRMLGGGSPLYVSNNVKAASPSFTSIKASVGSAISAIAVSPGNSDIIWVGHNDGRVYKTINGTSATPTWTAVDDNSGTNPFPNRFIGRITFDPSNPNRVWVGIGGFNNDNLWLTADSGATWTNKSGSDPNRLPSAPIRGIAVHPTDSNKIYIGTEVGLCVSTDGGSTWASPANGPLNVSVDEANFMYNSDKLLLATHGRGIWMLGPVTMGNIAGPVSVTKSSTNVYTVSVDEIAPAGGIPITLSSSNSGFAVPSTVTIPERQTSVTFNGVASSTAFGSAVITAGLDGDTRTLTVAIEGIGITDLIVNPTQIIGGSAVACQGKVVISAPAPSGGILVTLQSTNPAGASVPATVLIGTNKTSQNFVITHYKQTTKKDLTIKATYNGVTKSKAMTVNPPQPVGVVFNPKTFVGGSAVNVTCTVTVSIPAPAGFSVNLVSSDASVPCPSTLVIPEGATSATFNITDLPVTFQKQVAIKATAGNNEQRGYCVVQPPTPQSITFSVNPVVGGSATTEIGTVFLDVPAPAGGAKVLLSSSITAAATVPSFITIPAGSTSGTFTITHKKVTSQKLVTITASYFTRKTAVLTVNP